MTLKGRVALRSVLSFYPRARAHMNERAVSRFAQALSRACMMVVERERFISKSIAGRHIGVRLDRAW